MAAPGWNGPLGDPRPEQLVAANPPGFATPGRGYDHGVEDQEEGPRFVGTAFVGVPPGTTVPKPQRAGRTCAAQECDTVLSVYNPAEVCSVHAAPALQLPVRRRSAVPVR